MTQYISKHSSRYKSNHLISDISYARNYVLCICGWEGKVEDLREHQLFSPPLEDKGYENAWKKIYGNRSKREGYIPLKEASMLGNDK